MLALPEEGSLLTEIFDGQVIVGNSPSATVTVKLQLAVCAGLALSETVTVKVVTPLLKLCVPG
jgi:hypothetical protein